MIVESIVEQHWEEAAFLWTQRDRAAVSPRYTLRELARLDDRVDAHLDALRIAGDDGWPLGRALLEDVDSGVLFPLTVLAFESGDRERMRDVVVAASATAPARRSVISAMGWLRAESVEPWLLRLLHAGAPAQRLVGIAGCAVRRLDPGDVLEALVGDADPVVRARAVRAVGELGRRDLADRIRRSAREADDATRFWSAWTLARFAEPDGLRAIEGWARGADPQGDVAAAVAVRAFEPGRAREFVRELAADPALFPRAILAAGEFGDPSCVPWLIDQMGTPERAPAAGVALSLITGVDLDAADLLVVASAPQPAADGQEADSGEAFADPEGVPAQPPDPERVRRWWVDHEHAFQPGLRYLAGRTLDAASARQVLETGSQVQRRSAAMLLALDAPDAPLFEVRRRSAEQQHVLAARAV